MSSIQSMKICNDWYAFKNMARENTKIKVGDWIKKCVDDGAGEILLTSIRHDGLMEGFDFEMYNKYCDICEVPLIIAGGFNGMENLANIRRPLDALAAASIFHYNKSTPREFKKIFSL